MPKPESANQWQIQEAKARLSEVFRLALSEGPQRVTRHGREAVVIVADQEYQRLRKRQSRARGSLVEFFRQSPLAGSNINLERKPDYGRESEL